MEAYLQTIQKLAEEEAQRINSEAGYKELDPEDLAQDVILDILEQGGLDTDRHGEVIENPDAFIRRMLRHKAMQARAKRTEYGRSTPVYLTADLDEDDPNGFGAWLQDNAADSLAEAFEDEVVERLDGTVVTRTRAFVQECIDDIEDLRVRRVAEAYFLDGREPKDIAAEMVVSRQVVRHLLSAARAGLGEQVGDAQALRDALYPDARTPKGDYRPSAMLASLAL